MLRNNPILFNLQKQFRAESTSSLENIYYTLACDIQDIVLAKQKGATDIELRNLANKIENSRNTIKTILKSEENDVSIMKKYQ